MKLYGLKAESVRPLPGIQPENLQINAAGIYDKLYPPADVMKKYHVCAGLIKNEPAGLRHGLNWNKGGGFHTCHPTVPDISKFISLLSSMEYSRGISFATGSMNPFTSSPSASDFEIPLD